MKITFPSFLLLFILTTTINAQQKIGFKIILDQNFKYSTYDYSYVENSPIFNYNLYYYKRNSKSYGLTYEKVLSNKLLLSLETGLYLNNQASSCISSTQGGSDSLGTYQLNSKTLQEHTNYFSDNELHTYTLERKIKELHIPILIKKYFFIKSALFFVSVGPKLALTLSDKTSYEDVNDNSILMKRNNFDFDYHSSRFYLINTLNINLGFEYKKVQISTSYALSNIRNLHSEQTERYNYNNKDNSFRTFLLSLSIGYTL
jgi:hypothetical protein